jgi:hypothetical protein
VEIFWAFGFGDGVEEEDVEASATESELDLVVENLLEGEIGEEVPAMIADLVVVHDEGIVEDSTY